jgi:hypothetical protein
MSMLQTKASPSAGNQTLQEAERAIQRILKEAEQAMEQARRAAAESGKHTQAQK